MKWLPACALMAVLGVTLAHSLAWGAVILPFYLLSVNRYRPPKKLLLYLLGCCFLFYVLTIIERSDHKTFLTGEETLLPLRIVEPFSVDGQMATTSATTEKGEIILVKAIIPEGKSPESPPYTTPSWCYWNGTLEPPPAARNPHSFNYQKYLWNQNTHWIFKTNTIDKDRQCYSVTYSLKEKLRNLRSQGIDHLYQVFPSELHPLGKSLIFGDRKSLDEKLLDGYQQLGVIHLLAISGMHVGMVVALIWWSLLRLGFTKEKVKIFLLISLPFYAFMTGASPPVVRAVSMVMAVLILTMLSKRITLVQALAISLCIQLLINPMNLLQIGFQLSYAVSFSIALSATAILSSSSWMTSILKVTTISQLGAFPILLWHFHEISLASFFTNILYIPLFTIVLLPVFLGLFSLSFLVPDISYGAGIWFGKGISLIDSLTLYLTAIPYTTMVLGQPANWLIFIYICSLLYLFVSLEKRFSLLPLFLLLVIIGSDWFSSRFNPLGTVLFIDVGQGDCILIDLPWGEGTYLIDTGGALSFGNDSDPFLVGKEVIWPVLRGKGITTIDKIILTHGDWDHIGGTMDLTEYVNIKEVWITPGSHEKESVENMLIALQRKSIPVVEKKAPYSWKAGNAKFDLLYPSDSEYDGNNHSLVIWAEIGGLSWLFTGDLEEQGEKELVEQYDLKADVLKVGHHGSHTSTTQDFFEHINPAYAIISAGVNNRFNHPHADVTARIADHGTRLYGTYSHGAIQYQFYKNKGTFSWFLPYDEE